MSTTFAETRNLALCHFPEEERSVIERYFALCQQITHCRVTDLSAVRQRGYNKPHIENFHTALEHHLFEKESLDPKSFAYHRRIRIASE